MKHRNHRPLLGNRNFLLLFGAYGISAFGDHLSEAGILVEMGVGEGDEKTRIGALMLFCFFLPYVLLGPLAGAVADRLPRRLIMISADVARGLIALGIPLFIGLLDDRSSWLMLTPILALGVFACFFNPARLSFVPDIVEDARLTEANSLLNALAPVAAIISYVVGGWLAGISTTVNFISDGVTFFASGILIALIVVPRRDRRPTRRQPVLQDMLFGFAYLRSHRCVWQLMIFTAVFWTSAGIFKSALTTVVFDWYGLSVQAWGVFQATIGVGMVLGAIMLTAVGDASRAHYNIVLALLGTGLSILLFTLTRNYWLGGVLAMGVGLFGVWIMISANTLIQRIVPNHARGKVFGIIDLVNMSGMLLATGLLGDPFGVLHFERLDAHIGTVLALLGLVLMVAGVVVWRHHARRSGHSFGLYSTRALNEVVCKFWYRLRRAGPCTLPLQGPCLITANHVSTADPCFLVAGSPHRLFGFMIAREYYDVPLWRHLIRALECIPVRRDGNDIAATKQALRQLRAGKALAIFIEGRVTGPDMERALRDGVAVLALRSGAPVYPAHISGVKWSEGTIGPFFFRHRVRVKYGPPVDLADLAGARDRAQVQEATERIWRAIEALAPEDGRVFLERDISS